MEDSKLPITSAGSSGIGVVSGHLSFKPTPSKESVQQDSKRELHSLVPGSRYVLDAYSRHKQFINDYVKFYGGNLPQSKQAADYVSDYDILRKEHRFLREDADDAGEETYEKKLAKKYYDKLFKEYCIADMTRFQEGKVGMRWRTQKEVFEGKGQFICGNKHCDARIRLKSFEVNFAYVENKEKKNALVKLRLCTDCAEKLHYKKSAVISKKRVPEEEKISHIPIEESGGKASAAPPAEKKQKVEEEKEERAVVEEKKTEPTEDAVSSKWKEKPSLEKTKEEEFEEYFRELFP